MCGIAGIMTADGGPPDEGRLTTMSAALAHRGPDGRGHYVNGDVGMVQTRLAIIDLETGDQPIYEPGGAALVANAEIYNYLELREGLADAAFATNSDCEPALHLYRRLGIPFAEPLRGMYAIAIHDPDEGRLVLARDRFGIKPLYYVETTAGFAFASEPQALIAAGLVAPQVTEESRAELLQLQFTTGRGTIFERVHRVLPGETLVVSRGRVVERRHLAALPAGGPSRWNDREALARLDEALADSVAVHQRSDVPYGMFLSSGIDSAVILAMMARLNERPVRAFTAGFSGTSAHDERALARRMAQRVGAEHVEIEVSEDDFWAMLPAIAAAVDDPAADYAVVPTWKLARTAGEELKVILCGEGGDELFAGYGRYRSALRPWWQGGRAMRPRGIFDGLGVLRRHPTGWRDGIVGAESTAAAVAGRSRLQVAQAVDIADWLPNDLLIKLDRCLMAHGVEGRTPYLDPEVVEVAFRLGDSLKIRKGLGKYITRRWLADHLPEAEAFARKRGFTVPVGEWIARRGRDLGTLVARQPGVREVCAPQEVRRLFDATGKRPAAAQWVLLFYALWHRRHVLGATPGDDVFETLAAPA